MDRWKEKLGDKTISIEEIKQTYKMFHTKDIGTKHLDYNIRLTFGKTKFKDQLANFAGTNKEFALLLTSIFKVMLCIINIINILCPDPSI